MASLQDQLAKCPKISPQEVENALFDFIKSISKELVELNKKQINEQSEDIYGKAIGFYSKATEIISDGAKGAGQPFTGKDTGNWLDAFYVSVVNNTLYFGSTDPKTDDILDSPNWLSQDLFGLTEDNLYVITHEKFKPFVIEYYRKSLDL